MNLIERAISGVSPAWAYQRFRRRMQLKVLREYEAAQPSRLRKDNRSKGSPDAIGRKAVEFLRERARALEENYDIAVGILDVLADKTVGSGIRTYPMARLRSGDLAEELNDYLLNLFDDWILNPDVTGEYHYYKAQRLAARSWYRDGEVFTRLISGDVAGLDHVSEVPFSIELIESDQVPLADFVIPGADKARHGIVKNRWGRPLQYVVWDAHPGDRLGLAGMLPSTAHLVGADDMLHLKMTRRVKQTRGVSVFAPVFTRLEDLKDYEESERVAARIGAAVALQITKSLDVAQGSPTNPMAGSPRELDWMPGIIFDQLASGEKIESIKNERPSNQLKDFRATQLRAATAGVGAGYSSVARDYNGTYSAQRQELVEIEAHYAVNTEEFVSRQCRPTYQRFVAAAVAHGHVPLLLLRNVDLSTVTNAAYRGPGVAYIDPLKEIRAQIESVQAGFTSKTKTILRQGDNPADTEREIKLEREREAADGVVTTSNPANKMAAPAEKEPGLKEAEDEDEAEDDEGNRYIRLEGLWWPADHIEVGGEPAPH